MDVLYEFRALLILPFLALLFWAATKGRKRNVPQPAPVAPAKPQQSEPVEVASGERVDKAIWVLLIIAVLVVGFLWYTSPNGSEIPDVASIQRILAVDSWGTLFADWNTLTGNPDGSRPVSLGTAAVMLGIAILAFILGGKRRGA